MTTREKTEIICEVLLLVGVLYKDGASTGDWCDAAPKIADTMSAEQWGEIVLDLSTKLLHMNEP